MPKMAGSHRTTAKQAEQPLLNSNQPSAKSSRPNSAKSSRHNSAKSSRHNSGKCSSPASSSVGGYEAPTIIGYRPVAEDGGWGWAVVLAAFLIHVIVDGFIYSFGIMSVQLIDEFNEGRALTSWIISLMVGLYLGVGPVAGGITNRFGCRLTTIGGALIATAGCLASYFATSIIYLLVSVGVVMGIGFGLMFCPAMIIVTMYFEKKRSFATGIAVCGAGVGTLLFAPLTNILIEEYTWRGAFLIYAGIILNGAVCGALFRPIKLEAVYSDDFYDEDDDELEDDEYEAVEEEKPKPSSNGYAKNFERVDKPLDRQFQWPNGSSATARRSSSPEKTSSPVTNKLPNLPQIVIQRVETLKGELANEDGALRAHSQMHVNFNEVDAKISAISRPPAFSVGMDRGIKRKSRSTHSLRRRTLTMTTGWMNMKDVTYANGSIMQLPSSLNVNSTHDVALNQARRATIISAGSSELNPIATLEEINKRNQFSEVLKQMIDLSVLTQPVFLLYCCSNFLTSVGLNPPLILLPDKSHALGLDPELSSLQLSAFGVSNTIGRLLFGYICDHEFPCRWGKDVRQNRLWTYNVLITCCGLSTLGACWAVTQSALLIYATFFGFTLSAYLVLTSVLMVDLVGVEHLTNGFGVLMLFQGIASLIGAPIAGLFVDMTGGYNEAFMFSGLALFLSAVMLYFVPCFANPDKKGNNGGNSPS